MALLWFWRCLASLVIAVGFGAIYPGSLSRSFPPLCASASVLLLSLFLFLFSFVCFVFSQTLLGCTTVFFFAICLCDAVNACLITGHAYHRYAIIHTQSQLKSNKAELRLQPLYDQHCCSQRSVFWCRVLLLPQNTTIERDKMHNLYILMFFFFFFSVHNSYRSAHRKRYSPLYLSFSLYGQ